MVHHMLIAQGLMRGLAMRARKELGPNAPAEEVARVALDHFRAGAESLATSPSMSLDDHAFLLAIQEDNRKNAAEAAREAEPVVVVVVGGEQSPPAGKKDLN